MTSARERVHRTLLRWYRAHGRPFPWRADDGPYSVLVSEFMLQQTQAARVISYHRAWMQRFPGIEDVAAASRRDVLLAWAGLGYNRRCLHLHEAAKQIVVRFNGHIPSSTEDLRSLPGVGRYTAAAVRCFGFRIRDAVVDVNIARIISRWQGPDTVLNESDIWTRAWDLLPVRTWYDWNQALMDLGALYCVSRTPRCAQCPVRGLCPSAGLVPEPDRPKSHEPRSVPRRIFRGRLLRLLRESPGHQIPMSEAGPALIRDYTSSDRAWLLDIIHSLERDGMLTIAPISGETHRRRTAVAEKSPPTRPVVHSELLLTLAE